MEATDMSNPAPTPSFRTKLALLPAQMGQGMTLVLLAPVVPMIANHFGGGSEGSSAAQAIAVFPFLGLVIAGLGSGWVIRLLGLKATAYISAVGFIIAGLIGLIATSIPQLLAASALMGVGAALLTSSLSAITAIYYDGVSRARLVGVQAATGNFAALILGLGAGFLAEQMGWRTPFGVFLVAGALLLILFVTCLPKPPRQPVETSRSMMWVAKHIWLVAFAAILVFVITSTQSTQLPFLMEANGLVSPGLRAIVMTVLMSVSMLGSLAFSAAQGRLKDSSIILIAGCFTILGWAVFGVWTEGLMMAVLAAGLIGFGMGLIIPLLFNTAMRLAPGEASGEAIGIVNAGISVGSLANPLVTAPLRSALGLSGLMMALSAAALVGTIVSFFKLRMSESAENKAD